MDSNKEEYLTQVQARLEQSTTEILSFDVFKPSFQVFSDRPHELRSKLAQIAKAGSRVYAFLTEFRTLHFHIKGQHSLAQEILESARARGMADMPPETRKGLSKEERQAVIDRSLDQGEVENANFWKRVNTMVEDYIRLVEGRIKELAFAQKNILGQISAIREEQNLHGNMGGGSVRFGGTQR